MRGPSSIKCSCGFHNDPWRLFCGGCGLKLGPACASCGFVNLAVTFCGGCGTGLAETKPAKPAAEAKAAKPAADAKAPKPVIPAPAVPARKAAPAHNATIPIILDDLDPTE